MHAQGYTVCVVDPDEAVHDALSVLLQASGVGVKGFCSAEAFLESGLDLNPAASCIIAEANLPGMGCLSFLRKLHADDADIPVIVVTSTSDRAIAEQVVRAGALDVIEKPLVGDRLLERLIPASGGCRRSVPNESNSADAKSACKCNILEND